MKIACLISGLPRSIKYNIEKIKNILGENTDYFVHVTKKYDDNYKNIDINYDNIIKKLNPIISIIENEVFTDKNENENKFINMKRQWYKFNQINPNFMYTFQSNNPAFDSLFPFFYKANKNMNWVV